jgi:hypothetical protein
MSGVYETEIVEGVFEAVEAAPPCVSLVAVEPTADRAPGFAVPRVNASFVTQLIATAEQLPQTRQLRRAAPADALSAYQSSEHRIRNARLSTRQVA